MRFLKRDRAELLAAVKLIVLFATLLVQALLFARAEGRLEPVVTAPQGVRGASVPIRVVFEKDGLPTTVNGFTAEDVVLANGALSDFTNLGGAYAFKVAPSANEFTVSIPAGAADNRFAVFTKADAGTPFYSWKRRMEISFPGYGIGRETLVDFPALIVLADGAGVRFDDFNARDNVPWADLRFTAEDKTTELSYEVESWNLDGKSYVWVRVPKLTADTRLYAFWRKAGAAPTPASSAKALWAEDYAGVWHFSGEGPAARDFSGRENVARPVGAGVKPGEPGKVGRAVRMTQEGGNGGLKVADGPSLDFGEQDFTLETWVRKEEKSSGWKNIGEFGKWWTGAEPGKNEWSLGATKTGNDDLPGFTLEIGQTSHRVDGADNLVVGEWNHVAGVREGEVMRLYVNGVEQGTKIGVKGPVNNAGRDLHFGYFASKPELSARTTLDEVRISTKARSADWVRASYLSAGEHDVFTAYRLPSEGDASSVAASATFARHWAYETPVRPEVPETSDPAWSDNPIDRFVRAGMERHGLRPNPPADPATWLRRVSFDLIGLPPTLGELDDFLRDPSPEAKVRAVDRLLRSRHFGERRARRWLDLARYGDSTGIHEDVVRPSWAWRDWVVQAFNADMPFDRFTIEQLAGDLLPEATLQQRIATGFHRAAPFNTEAGTPKEARRTYQVLDRVNVTGEVWLGTTLECARCHDHKYDPFTQRDYYRLFAYFNNTPDEMGRNIGAGRAAMEGPTVKVGDTTTFVMREMPKPRSTRIFNRGNYETPGASVAIGLPQSLHPPAADLPANRLGLARWLVDPANPLTARVTVNRFWAELFGTGLVPTGSDFGTQGEPPTHPALLDWLAVEFMENGWSVKRLLRAIVLSATYGQASDLNPEKLRADPDNRRLSRAPRLRLSAEAIRDNALAAAGILSPAMGGPPVYPPQPEGIWWIRDDKSPVYKTSVGEDRYRRTLYVIWRRTYLHPTLANFDAPDRITCAAERQRTNTPLQALTLLNDPIFLEAAFGLARRMAATSGSLDERIAAGFRLATSRRPDSAENKILRQLYQTQLARYLGESVAAEKLVRSVRGQLAAATSPVNPRTTAELAAWFHLANVLLNLDETITKG